MIITKSLGKIILLASLSFTKYIILRYRVLWIYRTVEDLYCSTNQIKYFCPGYWPGGKRFTLIHKSAKFHTHLILFRQEYFSEYMFFQFLWHKYSQHFGCWEYQQMPLPLYWTLLVFSTTFNFHQYQCFYINKHLFEICWLFWVLGFLEDNCTIFSLALPRLVLFVPWFSTDSAFANFL